MPHIPIEEAARDDDGDVVARERMQWVQCDGSLPHVDVLDRLKDGNADAEAWEELDGGLAEREAVGDRSLLDNRDESATARGCGERRGTQGREGSREGT
jgi:hypothetical protein